MKMFTQLDLQSLNKGCFIIFYEVNLE